MLLASRDMAEQSAPAAERGPEAMRSAMADYVSSVHRAYLEASASLPPGERARLPLVAAGNFTVAAVGTRYLHVVATTDALPAPTGPEVSLDCHEGDLAWRLRFFDPVVLPDLGLLDESQAPQPQRIREILGLAGVVYHLTVPPGGGLTPHHALHSGTGLAHSHAAAARDYETLTALAPRQADLISEMHAAETAGLQACVVLMAQHLAPRNTTVLDLQPGAASAVDARRRLLAAFRDRT
jgi:hypothetical protein